MRKHILLTAGVLLITLTACAIRDTPQVISPTLSITTPTATLAQNLLDPTAPPQFTSAANAVISDELVALSTAKRLPRDKVTLAYELGGACRDIPTGCPKTARTTPLDVRVGDKQDFWITNFETTDNYTVSAELRYIGPVVLMYVEQGLDLNQLALERAAQTFEQEMYPRTRALFGSENQPGVDGDPRIVVLNARGIGSVLGYFSERDTVPRTVNRFSNEREMFFMNAGVIDPDKPEYLDVLTHEFQHMIHWSEQSSSPTWFNEGCSTLAEDLNGFVNHGYALSYLQNPNTQLTGWDNLPGTSAAHYGAANLFLRYIYAQYAREQGISALIRANAGNNLDVFVHSAAQTRPDIDDFEDIFADWLVTNLLNDPALADGRYTYATGHQLPNLLPTVVTPQPLEANTIGATVQQFGAHYHSLPAGPLTLEFSGDMSVKLTGTMPRGKYAWWSGRNDNSIGTLTRAFDLRGLTKATLQFEAWYEIENGYDYAFVSVSTDDGATWQTLPGVTTTDANPQGTNLGHGLTGVSGSPTLRLGDSTRGSWITETMDLTPFVGREILIRFWQVNDLAVNGPGLLINTIQIPQLEYFDDASLFQSDWQAAGFVRVDGDLSQRWMLRLVRTSATGHISIEAPVIDAAGQAAVTLTKDEYGVLIISATTPYTTEPGSYRLNITQ